VWVSRLVVVPALPSGAQIFGMDQDKLNEPRLLGIRVVDLAALFKRGADFGFAILDFGRGDRS